MMGWSIDFSFSGPHTRWDICMFLEQGRAHHKLLMSDDHPRLQKLIEDYVAASKSRADIVKSCEQKQVISWFPTFPPTQDRVTLQKHNGSKQSPISSPTWARRKQEKSTHSLHPITFRHASHNGSKLMAPPKFNP